MASSFNHPKKISRVPKPRQMVLDFGQKNFGPIKCKECSMVYVAADCDDIKSHQKFHAEFLSQEIKAPKNIKSDIHEDYFNGDQIVELSLSDKITKQFFQKLLILMNNELGYDRPLSASNPDSNNLPSYLRLFVYIKGLERIAIGCCIAEELTAESVTKRDYYIRRLTGGRKSLLSWRVQNSSIDSGVDASMSENAVVSQDVISLPLCGIRRLWVSSKYRRRGYATAIVECVTKHLFYLSEKSRSEVAFAEPTSTGAEFAVNFVGREDFLIY